MRKNNLETFLESLNSTDNYKAHSALLKVTTKEEGGLFVNSRGKVISEIKFFRDNDRKIQLVSERDFKVNSYLRNGNAHFERQDFSGWLSLKDYRGTCKIAGNQYSFNSFLRIIFSLLAVELGGVLLHSSGSCIASGALLFIGKSGSGKSTIIKNLLVYPNNRNKILSDEITLVMPSNNDGYNSFSTPFFGTLEGRLKITSKQAPVKKIFFLKKSNHFNIKKLKRNKALERLLPNIIFFLKDGFFAEKVMSIAAGITEKIPCYELSFTERVKKNEYKIISG
ncbi:MAG: hypothetical protein AB1633_05935 [Elusimicrobiota bacterium]